jgi:leader peptidase (prepilin peptidase)/N-methyltransferase
MLPLVIILSSLAGAVIGGTLIALGRDRADAIPFGPFLAIAGWLALMFGETITAQYLQFVAA